MGGRPRTKVNSTKFDVGKFLGHIQDPMSSARAQIDNFTSTGIATE